MMSAGHPRPAGADLGLVARVLVGGAVRAHEGAKICDTTAGPDNNEDNTNAPAIPLIDSRAVSIMRQSSAERPALNGWLREHTLPIT